MKVLTIGSDKKLFEEGSAVRARAIEYASLFEELHIIVFSKRNFQLIRKIQIAENAWVYPTNSWSRWLYVRNAVRLGRSIVKSQLSKVSDWVVSGQDPFESGLAASRIAARFNLPLHIQIHTDFLSPYFAGSSFLNRIRLRIASRVLPQAKAIRVVSERIKDSLLQVASYKLQTVPVVLPIFTDLQKFASVQPSSGLKQKYPQWNFIILIASRLSPEKNISFALDVLYKLVKKYPRLGMVIVGEGPCQRSLKSKVRSLKLRNSVAFLPWQPDLASYYKTANLFLLTSLYDGFALTLLEAVASGCPTVSSDVGVARELLNHKGHSFVCSVNDLNCFTEKISRFIEDNQLREFFSTQIAPSAALPFETTKEKYLTAYKESIESAVRL